MHSLSRRVAKLEPKREGQRMFVLRAGADVPEDDVSRFAEEQGAGPADLVVTICTFGGPESLSAPELLYQRAIA